MPEQKYPFKMDKLKHVATETFLYGIPAFIAFVLLIHLSVRDGIPALSPLYYVGQPPLLGLLAIASAGVVVLLKRKTWATVFLGLGISCVLWWFCSGFHNNRADEMNAELKILSWNVQKQTLNRCEEIVKTIKAQKPDIFGFIELGDDAEASVKKLRELLPDYSFKLGGDCLLIASKGEIEDVGLVAVGDGFGRYAKARVRIKSHSLTIYLVDMGSTPSHPRVPALSEIFMNAAMETSGLIAMGDFNTPYESTGFDCFRKNFKNSFAETGNGFMASWPLPCPLIDIDHAWSNNALTPVAANLISNSISDHKILTSSFKFNERDEFP